MDEARDESLLKEAAAESFTTYLEYNKILRTWFVAFGVGGPALFLVNEKIAERLAKAGMLRDVAAIFLIGAAAQIAGALLNKITNWYVYIAAHEPHFRGTCGHRFSEWFTREFWSDILIDVLTIACFGYAGWQVLTIFAK